MTNPTVPAAYKREVKEAVLIGKHCIIGSGSIIGSGVSLAEGTALGASTLVLVSTEPWSIYAGSTAKNLGNRSCDLLQLEGKYLQSENPNV